MSIINIKRKEIIRLIILGAILCALFLAMTNHSAYALSSKVSISKSTITTYKGGNYNLKLKHVANENVSKIKWYSNNKVIATVSAKGKVTGRKNGATYIKAKYKGRTYKCRIICKTPTFTISPKSKYSSDYNGLVKYDSNYTHASILRTYLRKLAVAGGGTLVITAGTYNMKMPVYVPSNVTIRINDGVTFVKDSGYAAIFYLVSPLCVEKRQKMTGYNGSHDISIVGKGKVIFDMNYVRTSIAIEMAHCRNISIKGLNFKNMYDGHFIEANSSEHVLIDKCDFRDAKYYGKETSIKEAINIDNADPNTGGIKVNWCENDYTQCKDVKVSNCTFADVLRAIGSHKYSEGLYHENVSIVNNYFGSTYYHPIKTASWKDMIICDNTFNNSRNTLAVKAKGAILNGGVINPSIYNNVFNNYEYAVRLTETENFGNASYYKHANSYIEDRFLEKMKNNTFINIEKRNLQVEDRLDDLAYPFTKEISLF